MGNRIVKQPNGLLACFSDIVDNFTVLNMNESEAIDWVVEQYDAGPKAASEKVQAGLNDFKPFSKQPGSGLDRWNDCLETIEFRHGPAAVLEIIAIDKNTESN